MEHKDVFPIVASILVIALVLAGEIIVTTDSHDDFSTSVAADGDGIQLTIESRRPLVYTAISLTDSIGAPKTVSVFYDKNYVSAASSGIASTGGRALDENYYVKQIDATLKVRGIDYSKIVDAGELAEIMSEDGMDNAVIVISGSLPDTVYDGTADSLVLDWIGSGGRLYWIGGILGKYISHTDSVETVDSGTSLFLGSECIDDTQSRGYDPVGNGFRDALYIQSNLTTFGVDTSKLPEDVDYLSLGFTDGSRSSITVAGVGEGLVCVIGGEYTIRQRLDLAQMVASGIGPNTEIADTAVGSVSGTEKVALRMGDYVYVTIGGYFPVYAGGQEVGA